MFELIELKNRLDIINTFSQLNKNTFRQKRRLYNDDILTFDIETTSLFDIEGDLKPFDYSLPKDYYTGRNKVALPYIWQFGYNDNVYYCRDFFLFATLLQTISEPKIHNFIYIHNLAFEFEYLLNIVKRYKWTIENLIARGLRKVIQFTIPEINTTFRCSYALTNLSLQKSGEQFNTPHSKLTGDLDYNVARSPFTPLDKDKELPYCENDILVMYEFLSIYKKEYGSVKQIPLTQTGEVRRDINKRVNYGFHKKVWDNIPNSTIYQLLMWAFLGGIVHANYIYTGKVIKNLGSFDYSSSYPFRMATCKFPQGKFFRIDENEIDFYKEKCCILYHIKIKNFKSKILNHYIPSSKCINKKGCRYDNGRIIKGQEIETTITDIDFEIIKDCYEIEEIEYIDLYACYKTYLPYEIIDFILEYFENKTKLKGIEEKDYLYRKNKAKLNSSFGCAVTNQLKSNYIFDMKNPDKMWEMGEFTEEFIESAIDKMKQSYSTLFIYSVGVWITAYARQGLWKLVSQIDKDSAYYDTDSDKIKNYKKYLPIIEQINKENLQAIEKVCEYYDIPIERFTPTDIKGKKHTLGLLEFEGEYEEFKTLGAKKYVYRENGELHMTLSGVRKSAVTLLNNDINNFKNGFEFDYSINKLNMIYRDGKNKQEPFTFTDKDGKEYHCSDIEFSVVAQPTTYTLGITKEYEQLLEFIEEHSAIF